MTMQLVPGIFFPPHFYGPTASAPSFTSFLLNASGMKYAVIFNIPKTGNIRKIHFRTGSVTTGRDTDCRLETVDATTGNPSGTLKGTNANATVVAASITANVWVTSPAFTADCAVTIGDLVAVVLVPTSTPNFNVNGFTVGTSGVRIPYTDGYNGTTWTKATDHIPGIAIEYDDGSFYFIPNTMPASAVNTHTFNNGSTPDEHALKFKTLGKMRLTGLWLWGDTDGDFDIVVYDSNGTSVLSTTSIDKDNRQGTGIGHHFFTLAASVVLSANTFYRISIKPSSSTSLTIYSIDVSTAAIMDQLAGGQNIHHSTQTNGGGWSDTTTRRLLMGGIFDQIDDGAGSGGEVSYAF